MAINPPKSSHGKDLSPPISKQGNINSVPGFISLPVSLVLALINLSIVIFYSTIFGWGWTGLLNGTWEPPDHWSWVGGLVGFIAVVIRLIAIAFFAVPYVFMLLLGLTSAVANIIKKNHLPFAIALAIAHLILSAPILAVLRTVFFR